MPCVDPASFCYFLLKRRMTALTFNRLLEAREQLFTLVNRSIALGKWPFV